MCFLISNTSIDILENSYCHTNSVSSVLAQRPKIGLKLSLLLETMDTLIFNCKCTRKVSSHITEIICYLFVQ